MAKIPYINKKFRPETIDMIQRANLICEEYAAQGLVLTLRQLYYQFVARGWIANKQTEYKRLGSICQDARMAGWMDWDHLIDRTRNLQSVATWDNPEALIIAAARQYKSDLWADQHQRIEVWIEKDAAIGVIEAVCNAHQVPYFSCRGYTSVSEIHVAAQRIRGYIEQGSNVTILHIGDHDPSGLDMSRDIKDRLETFIARDWMREQMGLKSSNLSDIRESMWNHLEAEGNEFAREQQPWTIKRIALTVEQIETYAPPPNPAKETDSRFQQYFAQTGMTDSYELDALDPAVMADLVRDEIEALRNDDLWDDAVARVEEQRTILNRISDRWEDVTDFLDDAS